LIPAQGEQAFTANHMVAGQHDWVLHLIETHDAFWNLWGLPADGGNHLENGLR
jgi:hypothetical protein